jgi:hypothetical protein
LFDGRRYAVAIMVEDEELSISEIARCVGLVAN